MTRQRRHVLESRPDTVLLVDFLFFYVPVGIVYAYRVSVYYDLLVSLGF